MSSHHFVKEGQEPALFIADALSLALAEPLLEWAPFVVVTDNAADDVLQWGIKIDAILANFAQEDVLAEKFAHQQPVKIVSCHPQDGLLLTGVVLLNDTKVSAVNVMVERPDNWFALPLDLLKFQVTLLTPDIRWALIMNRPYEKWLAKSTKIRIHLYDQQQKIDTKGLIDQESFFETVHDGLVSVQSSGAFWIGEPF
jgi:hypothetical protein